MRRMLLAFLVVVVVGLAGVLAQQPLVINFIDAKAHVGEVVTVQGSPFQITSEPQSGFGYLNFGGKFPGQTFTAVIPLRLASALDTKVWAGWHVRITGTVQLDAKGIPQIVCSEASQVQLADATPAPPVVPPLPVASSPAAPARRTCCRVCTTGKPCGDACISQNAVCRQPSGCACSG